LNRKDFLLNFDFASYVSNKFSSVYETSDEDRVRVDCPFCDDTKGHLYVLVSAGLPYCQKCKYDPKSPVRFISDVEGISIREVLAMADEGTSFTSMDVDVEDLVDKLFEEEQEKDFDYKVMSLGQNFVPVTSLPGIPGLDRHVKEARKYLSSRGIGKEVAKRFGIRFCYDGEFSGRIIVPCYYRDEIVTFVARDLYGFSDRKYLNPKGNKQSDFLYNYDSIEGDTVVLVEGVFDAIHMAQVAPTVASFGKSLSTRQINLLNGFKRVIFYWDLDAYPQVEKYDKRIQAECFVVMHSDGRDAAERTMEENGKLIQESTPVDSVNYQMFKLEHLS
tara:strand:+ start:2962 stop:3957 length:996 start_codon:yes stop_codon:yes gene_type:complete